MRNIRIFDHPNKKLQGLSHTFIYKIIHKDEEFLMIKDFSGTFEENRKWMVADGFDNHLTNLKKYTRKLTKVEIVKYKLLGYLDGA